MSFVMRSDLGAICAVSRAEICAHEITTACSMCADCFLIPREEVPAHAREAVDRFRARVQTCDEDGAIELLATYIDELYMYKEAVRDLRPSIAFIWRAAHLPPCAFEQNPGLRYRVRFLSDVMRATWDQVTSGQSV
jgi:hypothetical protein